MVGSQEKSIYSTLNRVITFLVQSKRILSERNVTKHCPYIACVWLLLEVSCFTLDL